MNHIFIWKGISVLHNKSIPPKEKEKKMKRKLEVKKSDSWCAMLCARVKTHPESEEIMPKPSILVVKLVSSTTILLKDLGIASQLILQQADIVDSFSEDGCLGVRILSTPICSKQESSKQLVNHCFLT
jgi:hypothetical protein